LNEESPDPGKRHRDFLKTRIYGVTAPIAACRALGFCREVICACGGEVGEVAEEGLPSLGGGDGLIDPDQLGAYNLFVELLPVSAFGWLDGNRRQ